MAFSSSSRSSSEQDSSNVYPRENSQSRASTPTRSLDAISHIIPNWVPLPQRNKHKSHHIFSTSGLHPQTHAELAPDTCSRKKVPIEIKEKFFTEGGVDVTKLLRASRASLLKTAEDAGANALVDEQCVSLSLLVFSSLSPNQTLLRWSCTICGPKRRKDGTYKTSVRPSVHHYHLLTSTSELIPSSLLIIDRYTTLPAPPAQGPLIRTDP
jgi:hypothetical protein